MIVKATSGSGFLGTLLYLFHGHREEAGGDKDARIIGGNMAGETARQLSREFGQLRKLRPSLGKAVAHFSLSFSPEERSLNDEELGQIAGEFLAGMGFEQAAYVCVRHHDTEHQHAHIVACRASLDGKTISDSHTYRRAEAVARQLEIQHGLMQLTTTKEANMPNKKTFQQQDIEEREKEEAERQEAASGEALKTKQARELRRLMLTEAYREQVADALGEDFKNTRKEAYGLIINMKDGGRIIDRGDTLQAHRMSDEKAAKHLVALGKLKGWKSMQFTGSKEFLRLAFMEALAQGVAVSPQDEEQRQILDALRAEMRQAAEAEGMMAKGKKEPEDFMGVTGLRERLRARGTTIEQPERGRGKGRQFRGI